jgi:uncharacterized protein YqeY
MESRRLKRFFMSFPGLICSNKAVRFIPLRLGYWKFELTDPDFISLTQREIKKRRDSFDQYEKGGRPELAAKEKEEITILESFLPQPFTADELEALIKQTISEVGATSKKEMGVVIKAVQAKAAGKAEGKTISGLVSKLLP